MSEQHIVLDQVSWELYEHLLREVGNRPIRITYFQGSIEIASPLLVNEVWKKRISRLIELMAVELEIELAGYGSTTFRHRARKAGLEPDECYFVQHAVDMQNRYDDDEDFDLDKDPPPDLVIDIEVKSRGIERYPICAALSMPELWRFDGCRLVVLELTSAGRYRERDSSLAFPFLPMDKFADFVARMRTESSLDVLRSFQRWVRTLRR